MQAVPDGEYAGTMHQNLQVEAVKLALYGEDANEYYLQYQVYVENLGWMDPVNTLIGNQDEIYAGTVGRALQVEAIRIQILHR